MLHVFQICIPVIGSHDGPFQTSFKLSTEVLVLQQDADLCRPELRGNLQR